MTSHESEVVAMLKAAVPDLLALYRFGTHGSAFERKDSDIDLAILGRRPLEPGLVWSLGQELASKLGREVELVDLAQASTVLRAQVVAYGERLFCADPGYCEPFEDYILSAYAHLNEERRGILSDVMQRGSVYGG
jgi:predicted nucleotidyltransferase